MRHVGLLASGCQVYPLAAKAVLASSEGRLYVASTLSVYVYSTRTHQLETILQDAEITKSISAIAASHHLLAVSSFDGSVVLWRVKEELIVKRLALEPGLHTRMVWVPGEEACIIVSCEAQQIRIMKWQTIGCVVSELASIKVETGTKLSSLKINPHQVVAVGLTNGFVILFSLEMKKQKLLASKKTGVQVVDVEFDPLSDTYLLVAYSDYISLFDSVAGVELHAFEHQPSGVSSIAWMRYAPGSFLSSNSKTGTLRIWNVSQKQCLEMKRAAGEGINAILFEDSAGQGTLGESPHNLACAMTNGSILVWSAAFNQVVLSTQASHTETIFDCQFNPSNQEEFASCSFDGTIKLWQSSDLQLVRNLLVGDVVYSVEYSPDGRFILAGCNTGKIYLWNTETGDEMGYFHHHARSCYSLSWNSLNAGLAVSASADGKVVVFDVDFDAIDERAARNKSSLAKFKKTPGTPYAARVVESAKLDAYSRVAFKFQNSGGAPMYGVNWCPHSFNVFVAGSHDGSVRVFDYLKTKESSLLYVLQGHASRSFQCVWSPLVPGLLASGSDDRKVLIWQVEIDTLAEGSSTVTKAPSKELLGHTNNVRALSWNHELRSLLLSGSWDSSIRVWDVVSGVCLKIIQDHCADVYSLSSHPQRPFTYISCSRDSTIRQWELDDTFAALRTCAVYHLSLDRLIHRGGDDASPNSSPLAVLCGKKSKALNMSLGKVASKEARAEQLYKIFGFFSGSNGSLDVLECALSLLHQQQTSSESFIRPLKYRLVLPEDQVLQRALSDARKLESRKMTSSQHQSSLPPKLVQDLRQAALIYARAGDLIKYCTIMAEIGEWGSALSVAPGVSIKFWQDLSHKYAESLSGKSDEQCIPHFVALGSMDKAAQYYLSRENTKDALTVAVATKSKPASAAATTESSSNRSGGANLDLTRKVVDETFNSLRSSPNGPVLSASHYLASGFVEDALHVLEISGELDLAYAVSILFGLPTERLVGAMLDRIVDLHGEVVGRETGLTSQMTASSHDVMAMADSLAAEMVRF